MFICYFTGEFLTNYLWRESFDFALPCLLQATFYNVSLKLLPTVYHYTEQTNICNDIVRRRHQYLSEVNNKDVIRYIVDRFDRETIII